jgi:hypothetical protein
VNRRIGKPRTATKINGGKGMVIRHTDVNFPSYGHRIKFDFDGKEGVLVINHEYESVSGYSVSASIEWNGETFDEHGYMQAHGYDGWADYVHAHFNGTFMANRYEFQVPRVLVALIEKRVMEMQRTHVEA